ncbi:Fe2+-dependent dioxygenase [bacterium]|nr:MAG: Fe2+-dependent dioxygenase [bacterium]
MLICIDGIFAPEEAAAHARSLADASWEDGNRSAGTVARLSKRNRQLPDDSAIAARLGAAILQRVETDPRFISAALPSRVHPPRFNRYAEGDAYGTHVDSALMPLPASHGWLRSDLSATLFLSSPDEYDGGVLEIESPSGAQAVKLEAGSLVLYPSDSLHRVTPVMRGVRYAAIFWLQSLVRAASGRTLLYDLDQAIQRLGSTVGAANPDLLTLTHVYHNLLRHWADP